MDALRLLLEEHGYTVLVADELESARAVAVRISKRDAVLLDIALPDGDGLELIDLWAPRERPAIFALTGHADDSTRSRCLKAGCRDVLVKPVSSLELIQRLEDALS